MRASEAIRKLQKLIAEVGDINLVVDVYFGGSWYNRNAAEQIRPVQQCECRQYQNDYDITSVRRN